MDNNMEIIFNLFLMEFWKDFNVAGYTITNIDDYLGVYNLSSFCMLRECYPKNEYCDHGKWTTLNWIEE